jgi:hypothetical protein
MEILAATRDATVQMIDKGRVHAVPLLFAIPTTGQFTRLGSNAYRQCLIAFDEARVDTLGLSDHLNSVEALQHFLPNDPKLEFGQPQADAAMNAEAE